MNLRLAIGNLRFVVGFTALVLSLWLASGCASKPKAVAVKPGQRVDRHGDEIMVCGQLFHTGAPVVLWTDPGGYDAYRTERRFAPMTQSAYAATTRQVRDITSPNRFGLRQ